MRSSPFRILSIQHNSLTNTALTTQPNPYQQVGDHCQLPPTVVSEQADAEGLTLSLFERLVQAGVRPTMLDIQYRMHPAISQFPSDCFYGGKVCMWLLYIGTPSTDFPALALVIALLLGIAPQAAPHRTALHSTAQHRTS